MIKTIEYKNGKLKIIDQRLLPAKLVYRNLFTAKDVKDAIKTLALRGAPAIGVAGAYGLYIGICNLKFKKEKLFFKKLDQIIKYINIARPTAVNLYWALEKMRAAAMESKGNGVAVIKKSLLDQAKSIHAQDKAMCKEIGKFGAMLIRNNDKILTHCNAGALATAGIGTALAAIYAAKKQGKKIKVYVDETRPLLQGARLTAWELIRGGIDVTLICDNMAASLMKKGKVDKILVGADRIALNGDFANKIGTYNLAVLANAHKIPFYALAPHSTFDFNIKNGAMIPIEERSPDEVRSIGGNYTAPENVKVYNPAFDVTPNELVTAFVTEKGIFRKPFKKTFKKLK